MTLQDIVSRIFAQLREAERFIADRRRPGLCAAEVQTKVRSIGLAVPEELVQLYGVCDGTDTFAGDKFDEIRFFPGFYWMNLSEAVEAYNALVNDKRWNRFWLPIFADGGGDFYAVICDDQSSDFGAIVGFVVDENDHLVEFQGLTSMLRTIERAFAEKAFFVDKGHLRADYRKMRAIARSVQPDFAEHDA